jgi:hypothetical protein
MGDVFAPSFRHFHNDIERHLKSVGKCEKNEHGQTVYRGYQDALDQMFRAYIDHEAFAPLVAEFRSWNWEWGYNDYLLTLTSCLRETDNWPLLKELWMVWLPSAEPITTRPGKLRRLGPRKSLKNW